jgi:gas vesicle protein
MEMQRNTVGSFVKGMLVGSIAASVISLFTLPRSGIETRRMIQKKGKQVHKKTANVLEKTRKQMNATISNARQRADQVSQRIQDIEGQVIRVVTRDSS